MENRALIIAEEKQLFLHNGTAGAAAKLIALQLIGRAGRTKAIPCSVQRSVDRRATDLCLP